MELHVPLFSSGGHEGNAAGRNQVTHALVAEFVGDFLTVTDSFAHVVDGESFDNLATFLVEDGEGRF